MTMARFQIAASGKGMPVRWSGGMGFSVSSSGWPSRARSAWLDSGLPSPSMAT